MNVLVFNPGGNSLKVEMIRCEPGQSYAGEGSKQVSASIEGIGREPQLSQFEGKKRLTTESIEARDFAQAADSFLDWYETWGTADKPALAEIDRVAVRVV